MEEKTSLFYRVVNSKTSVILYILTMAIFYFGSMIGGLFVARQMLPIEEIIILCGELISQHLGIFVLYALLGIMAFFTLLPIIGISNNEFNFILPKSSRPNVLDLSNTFLVYSYL